MRRRRQPGQTRRRRPRRVAVVLVVLSCLCAGAVLLLRSAFRDEIRAPSDSMAPTIRAGEALVVDADAYETRAPQGGDVIVFRPPFSEEARLVGRVIAVGPAEIDMRDDGTLLVDREPLLREREGDTEIDGERFATWRERNGGREYRVTWRDGDVTLDHPPGPWPVLEGKVFVMGDNRLDAFDSRSWGPVDREAVLGRVVAIDGSDQGGPVRPLR